MTDKLDLKKCIDNKCTDYRRVEGVCISLVGVVHKYRVECNCGISGPWRDTPEQASESWNHFAGITSRSALEQMEADCSAVCDSCKEGFDVHAPEHYDDGEDWFHIEPYEEYRQERDEIVLCVGSSIREAFRVRGEEVEA